ncbi:MAG: hypothetical protein QY309_07695 [Cyclobacteriaceae bacterium]|nr:MAG: hypothetical protein QY309_07695 [Cyclobacteriaceae bacterium]
MSRVVKPIAFNPTNPLCLGMALVNGLYKIKFNRRYHLMRIGTPSGKKMFKLDHGDWEPLEKLKKPTWLDL